MFCTYSFLQIFVFSTDFVYVPCSDTLIYGEQLMWTFPNLTLDLQTRITIVLEKETKNQPQPPCIRCERVIIILQSLLNFVFNVTRPPDTKLILSWYLYYCWNWTSPTPWKTTNFIPYLISSKIAGERSGRKCTFFSAFKISKSVKKAHWRQDIPEDSFCW